MRIKVNDTVEVIPVTSRACGTVQRVYPKRQMVVAPGSIL